MLDLAVALISLQQCAMCTPGLPFVPWAPRGSRGLQRRRVREEDASGPEAIKNIEIDIHK